MSVETAQYINQLNISWPLNADQVEEAAAHMRLIKSSLLSSFPNVGGAVSSSDADLSLLHGLAANPTLMTPLPVGTFCFFMQNAAPTGWTFVSTLNDKVLKVTSTLANGGTTGGSWSTTAVSVNGHTLTAAEIPAHTHTVGIIRKDTVGAGTSLVYGSGTNVDTLTETSDTGTGGGQSHTHALTVDSTWRPAFVNVIVCTKN